MAKKLIKTKKNKLKKKPKKSKDKGNKYEVVNKVEVSESVLEATTNNEPVIEQESVEKVIQERVEVVDDGKIECSPCKMAAINKALKLEYIKASGFGSLIILGSIAYFKKKDMPMFFDIIMTIFAYILFQIVIKIFELNKLKSTLKVKVN